MTILLLVLSATSAISQSNPDDILGTWETEKKDARMEVFKEGKTYQGRLLWGDKIVEADGTSKKDVKNPDEALQSREIVGIINLTNLSYEDGEYVDGRIYDPPSGRTYDCKAKLKDGKLHLRGFIGFSLLGRTAIWNKI
ncbi:DUF2147 domain-containing protein [Aquimarina sp. U1-2]|uniref:DUF2147 domain-containing protein n=1 Tax=Aquimarina sp. U1-2 TaxID=2823141 RepID=UPI001AECE457|nr:DUF2147 domain-containing protein [Aquimarina sp. U1-2]MBP2833113.1 DUF2147 domain-containing protein [Aquimarina sp. U1-2]